MDANEHERLTKHSAEVHFKIYETYRNALVSVEEQLIQNKFYTERVYITNGVGVGYLDKRLFETPLNRATFVLHTILMYALSVRCEDSEDIEVLTTNTEKMLCQNGVTELDASDLVFFIITEQELFACFIDETDDVGSPELLPPPDLK